MLALIGNPTHKEPDKLTEKKQPPEKWIGKEVYLRVWSGDKRGGTECTLQSVGAFGVTVFAQEELRFFPWHAVLEISPMSERPPKTARPIGIH